MLRTIRTNLGVPPRFSFVKDEKGKVDLKKSYDKAITFIKQEKPRLYSDKKGKYYKVILPNNKVFKLSIKDLEKVKKMLGEKNE